MKKFAPVLVIVGVLILGFLYFMNVKNKALLFSQATEKEWGNVNTAYQRRLDLIDNLVNTVKGAADFEKSTLTAVIQARASATAVNIKADELTPANIQKFQAAQDQLSGALSRLLVSVEKYPDLKANQNFLELQAQLEGTENRIKVERDRFNEVVKEYNQSARTFPSNIFAGMFGFKEKPYFEAAVGAEKPVEVKF